MRAIHKYKHNRTPENKRRVAQSVGYKHSIYDQPLMIELLKRADIDIQGVEYIDPHDPVSDTITL